MKADFEGPTDDGDRRPPALGWLILIGVLVLGAIALVLVAVLTR